MTLATNHKPATPKAAAIVEVLSASHIKGCYINLSDDGKNVVIVGDALVTMTLDYVANKVEILLADTTHMGVEKMMAYAQVIGCAAQIAKNLETTLVQMSTEVGVAAYEYRKSRNATV